MPGCLAAVSTAFPRDETQTERPAFSRSAKKKPKKRTGLVVCPSLMCLFFFLHTNVLTMFIAMCSSLWPRVCDQSGLLPDERDQHPEHLREPAVRRSAAERRTRLGGRTLFWYPHMSSSFIHILIYIYSFRHILYIYIYSFRHIYIYINSFRHIYININSFRQCYVPAGSRPKQ